MREKPLVIIVTDSDLQPGVTAEERRLETMRACEILGVPVEFLGLPDSSVYESDLMRKLKSINTEAWDLVYAPAIQCGHLDHDIVGYVASKLFHSVKFYSTYTHNNYDPFGQYSIVPTKAELDLKDAALNCYETQLAVERIRIDHFEMVRGKPEYMNDSPYAWRENYARD
jgi:LmbE family N-acetylglucosaminyl deacetylase